MKKIVYKCLNPKCKCEFVDYSKEGLNCPICSSPIDPMRESNKEDIVNLSTYKELKDSNMINKRSWKEFRDNGLLWWINMILHTFGWAIIFSIGKGGEVAEIYPARVKFRGFDDKSNIDGYIKISKFMKEHAEQLEKESKE